MIFPFVAMEEANQNNSARPLSEDLQSGKEFQSECETIEIGTGMGNNVKKPN